MRKQAGRKRGFGGTCRRLLTGWWRHLRGGEHVVETWEKSRWLDALHRAEHRCARACLALFDRFLWLSQLVARVEVVWSRYCAAPARSAGQHVARWPRVRRGLLRVSQWWGTRRLAFLLRGVPVVLAAGGVSAVAVLAARDNSKALTRRYQQEAEFAWRQGNFEHVKLCLQRLALSEASEPAYHYRLAGCEARLGNVERAWALMQSLAKPDRPGYGPAHLWQARQVLARGHVSAAELELAERHLLRYLDVQPHAPEADALLGQLYLARDRPDEAEQHLKQVAAYGEPLLALARLHASQGKYNEAQAEARVAQRFFRERTEAEPKKVAGWLHLAEATTLLGQFNEAIKILEEGLRHQQAPVYRLALAQTFDRWSAAPAVQGAAKHATRLLLVRQALLHDHGNVEALKKLLALSRVQGPEVTPAWAELGRQLAADPNSAALHLVVGMYFHARREHEQARQHFAAAASEEQSTPLILNNLAWVQAHVEQDAAQALPLIDASVRSQPENAHFRDTRGHVLAQLGRWREAAADLEAANAGLPENPTRQEVLKLVYRHLGRDASDREQPVRAESPASAGQESSATK